VFAVLLRWRAKDPNPPRILTLLDRALTIEDSYPLPSLLYPNPYAPWPRQDAKKHGFLVRSALFALHSLMSSSASTRLVVRTDALGATSLVNSRRGSRLAFFDSLTRRRHVQAVISRGLPDLERFTPPDLK